MQCNRVGRNKRTMGVFSCVGFGFRLVLRLRTVSTSSVSCCDVEPLADRLERHFRLGRLGHAVCDRAPVGQLARRAGPEVDSAAARGAHCDTSIRRMPIAPERSACPHRVLASTSLTPRAAHCPGAATAHKNPSRTSECPRQPRAASLQCPAAVEGQVAVKRSLIGPDWTRTSDLLHVKQAL